MNDFERTITLTITLMDGTEREEIVKGKITEVQKDAALSQACQMVCIQGFFKKLPNGDYEAIPPSQVKHVRASISPIVIAEGKIGRA